METRTTSSAAISEVLNVDNYLVWSVQVKTYLIGQDLWDIVEGIDECPKREDDEAAFKDWSKKNAMALHVIQISCPQRICHVISLITSAKIAWETLESICSIPKSRYFVPEEKEERYEAWSDRMKTFLMKHDLWNIVVETTNEPTTPAWSKKNALALYFIRESYGSDRFSLIEKISKAKDAWEEIEFKSVQEEGDQEQGEPMETETEAEGQPSSSRGLGKRRQVSFFPLLPADAFPMSLEMIDAFTNLNKIKLDDVDKYNEWSLQVKTELRDKQLWDIVEGTDEPPKAENDRALGLIRCYIKNEFLDAIRGISSAKIAWDTLAAISKLPKTDFEFLKEDGDNYLDWSLQVKATLECEQLWDIVEGTNDPPKAEKNDMALGLIRYSCFWSGLSDQLESITSAKIVWDALAAICALPKTKRFELIRAIVERLESIPAVIKRLDDVDNYKDWSDQVKTYLMDLQLWDIVEGTNEPPKAENDEAAFEKNAMALAVIVFSCGYSLRFAIWWITWANIAWDTLEEICKFHKSSYIDPEEKEESYVAWSNRMKTFLMNHNLWNIVETTTEPTTPAWSKKNALALYLIRESCGQDRFSLIEKISMAKIAWDTVAEMNKSNTDPEIEEMIESETGPVIADPEIAGMIEIADPDSGMQNNLSFEEHIRKGNWYAASQFIDSHPAAVSARISILGSTALHIAIYAGRTRIVEELVKIMSEEELEIKDASGFTVLGFCAIVGNTQMATYIIGKNRTLLSIGNGRNNLIPVVLALTYNPNGSEMVRYLYSETFLENSMPIINSINGATFITRAMYSKDIGMVWTLLERYPELAIAPDCNGQSPVEVLAGMPFAYRSDNRRSTTLEDLFAINLGCLGNDQRRKLKSLRDKSQSFFFRMFQSLRRLNIQPLENGGFIEIMIKNVKLGRVEFVTEILRTFPELVLCVEESTGRNIFMLAVLYRQDEVFHLLCRSPAKIPMLAVDFDSNSILHIAAMLEPSAKRNKAPGAALFMLREVQWLKEVKRVVRVVDPLFPKGINKNGQTPSELFIESHRESMKEGEKWMKGIANSCTVVGALIVTIMFAAAITVPGGNKQESGLPMFLNVKVFMLFIISDVLSLLFASISLLTFLGFTTSSYTVEDFLQSLPKKMMIGIATLIISIATMMITFCASLFIILKGKLSVIIPIIGLASVPVALFTWMQLRLLIDMIILTYRSGILDGKAKYGA